MKVKRFRYNLPERLIAQTPLKDRTASKLLVVDRDTGERIDTTFTALKNHLRKGDVLVINDTAVLPARLIGQKEDTGGVVEVLLLRQETDDAWECLVKRAKKVRRGTRVIFGKGQLIAECVEVLDQGLRRMKMQYNGIFLEVLEALGEMPLPPYIKEKLDDKDRYQTVYRDEPGSAAAPTAGLHFTKSYLAALQSMGVEVVRITLHVGLGTFRPVSVENVEDHTMHEEFYRVNDDAATTIRQAIQARRRIVAVGTTSMRTLETVARKHGHIQADAGFSNLFIYPGFTFQVVDALLTNFHLPESTLLMLVSAFSSQEIILDAYRHAIELNYRFFSFGDAMLLTRL